MNDHLRAGACVAAAGLWLLVALAPARSADAYPANGTAGAEPTPLPGSCRIDLDKTASKSEVRVGELFSVSLTFRAVCSAPYVPLHVVFVVDSSSATSAEVAEEIRLQIRDAMECILRADTRSNRVAIIEYARQPWVSCAMTDDPALVRACLAKSEPHAGRRIDRALRLAEAVLDEARLELPPWSGPVREVVVLVTAGEGDSGCSTVLGAADRLRTHGALMITVSQGLNEGCVRHGGTSPRYFLDAMSQFRSTLRCANGDVTSLRISRLTVTDTLSAQMAYEPSDEEGWPVVDLPSLVWSTSYIPAYGVTFTVRMRALEQGYHPTNERAVAAWADTKIGRGAAEFPVPIVHVLPRATETATPEVHAWRILIPAISTRLPQSGRRDQ